VHALAFAVAKRHGEEKQARETDAPDQKALLIVMAEIVKIAAPRRSSRSRLATTVAIIFLLVVLAAMAPLLAKYRGTPQVWVEKLEAMSQSQPEAPPTDVKQTVWVNRRSGLYYCRDSKLYEKMRPGFSMPQETALLKGFRPAQGQACR